LDLNYIRYEICEHLVLEEYDKKQHRIDNKHRRADKKTE
jgi:hypothetical protein